MIALILGVAYLMGFLFVVRLIVSRAKRGTTANLEFLKFLKFRSSVSQAEVQREVERDPALSQLGPIEIGSDQSVESLEVAAASQTSATEDADGSPTADAARVLAENWRRSVAAAEVGHRLTATRLNRQFLGINVLALVVSGAAGGFLFVVNV